MLISDQHRQPNEPSRQGPVGDGALNARRWGELTVELARKLDSWSILNYGHDQVSLGRFLRDHAKEYNVPLGLQEYDPASPDGAEPPVPADLVCCIEVLERVEPERVDEVLDDLARLAKRLLFAVIATRPAAEAPLDGSGRHQIRQPILWWLTKIDRRFRIAAFNNLGDDQTFHVFCEPRQGNRAVIAAPNGQDVP